MRNSTFRRAARTALLAALVAGTGACELDLTNPNSPPEELVLTTPDGIIALAVGMQGQYAGTGVGTGLVLNNIRAQGLVTDELSTTTRALAADRSLVTGAGVDASFGVVTSPYTTAFRVVRSAEELLENAPTAGLSVGTLAGINALARTYKAMALGSIIQLYQQVPVTATLETNPVQPRAVVLDSVLSLLEQARANLGSVAAADLADFNSRVAIGYNLGDVINAMLARYYLIDGQYQQAFDAAARVPLTRLNVFQYSDPLRNPVWGYSQFNLDYVRGSNEFVVEADTSDDRPGFWLRTDQATVAGSPGTLRNLRQYADRNAPYPIYLPDEMRLIQAEALTRMGQFPAAATLVNAVRTQCLPSATFGNFAEPVACQRTALTAAELDSEAELLAEIAYQRRYELYLQGTRWEDIRRFGTTVAGDTPPIQWFPLPSSECLLNPGTAC